MRKKISLFNNYVWFLEYETGELVNFLYYAGQIIAVYDPEQNPIQVFCDWLDNQTSETLRPFYMMLAEYHALRNLQLKWKTAP